MIEVVVLFDIKIGGVGRTKEMNLQVDRSTLSAASGSENRKKLDGWAKNFFPAADSARVISMKEVRSDYMK